ncbi:MAG: hypothetical protein WAK48_24055 [Candidatus Acidiferrum sp.]|jgi:hypothetical protein
MTDSPVSDSRWQSGLRLRHAGRHRQGQSCLQDFLTLWKDADPDIPILIAAKAEYAKLE